MGTHRTLKRISLLALIVATGLAWSISPVALAQSETPHVEVYGFVQADYIQDFDRVNPAWEDTLRPSKIPTTDGLFGDDGQASISAKQSRLGVLMNFPTSNKPVYTKFEFDMFGVGVDEGQTTIRLRHAYGQWGPWLAGQTNTLFMDASIFPNVVDYWGPAGMVFIRNPQIRWTPISGSNSFAIAVERPGNDVDPGQIRNFDPDLGNNITSTQKLPDLTAQFRSEHGWGHFQVAGVVRSIGFETLGTPDNEPSDDELGWGVDLTGSFKFLKKDKILGGVVYGEGIANYMNDGGTDMAADLNSSGNPEAAAVPLLGVSLYWDHWWSDKFSSSIGYSMDSVDNTDLQDDDAFYKGEYASANLLYYPTNNVFIGGEFLWGRREDNGGNDGTDKRVQISFHYSFSTKDIFKKAE